MSRKEKTRWAIGIMLLLVVLWHTSLGINRSIRYSTIRERQNEVIQENID